MTHTEIFDKFYPLVAEYAKSFGLDEDMEQELGCHLWSIVPRLDPERGNIEQFVRTCLWRKAGYFATKQNKDHDVPVYEMEPPQLACCVIEDSVLDDLVGYILDIWPAYKGDAILLYYVGGHSAGEVANILGLPRTRVSTIVSDVHLLERKLPYRLKQACRERLTEMGRIAYTECGYAYM